MRTLALLIVAVAVTACSDIATQPTGRSLSPSSASFNALGNVCKAPEQARRHLLSAGVRSLHLDAATEAAILAAIEKVDLDVTGRDFRDYLSKVFTELSVDGAVYTAVMNSLSCA